MTKHDSHRRLGCFGAHCLTVAKVDGRSATVQGHFGAVVDMRPVVAVDGRSVAVVDGQSAAVVDGQSAAVVDGQPAALAESFIR